MKTADQYKEENIALKNAILGKDGMWLDGFSKTFAEQAILANPSLIKHYSKPTVKLIHWIISWLDRSKIDLLKHLDLNKTVRASIIKEHGFRFVFKTLSESEINLILSKSPNGDGYRTLFKDHATPRPVRTRFINQLSPFALCDLASDENLFSEREAISILKRVRTYDLFHVKPVLNRDFSAKNQIKIVNYIIENHCSVSKILPKSKFPDAYKYMQLVNVIEK